MVFWVGKWVAGDRCIIAAEAAILRGDFFLPSGERIGRNVIV